MGEVTSVPPSAFPPSRARLSPFLPRILVLWIQFRKMGHRVSSELSQVIWDTLLKLADVL